jgi:hypothetical protein
LPKITINCKPEGRKKRGSPRRTWKDGMVKATSERGLRMGEWNNRRQWYVEVGRRRQTFKNRLIYINTVKEKLGTVAVCQTTSYHWYSDSLLRGPGNKSRCGRDFLQPPRPAVRPVQFLCSGYRVILCGTTAGAWP